MADYALLTVEDVKRLIDAALKIERTRTRGGAPRSLRNGPLPPFGVIRGTVTATVATSDTVFEIDHIEALGQSAPVPAILADGSDTVEVYNKDSTAFEAGQTAYAIYKEQDIDDPIGTGLLTVYWETFNLGGASAPGDSLYRIVLGTDVPACSAVLTGTILKITPGAGTGWLLPNASLLTGLGTAGDYWEIETDILGTDVAESVSVWNYNQHKIRCTAPDPEDTGTNPELIPQGHTIVFAKKFTYTLLDGTDPITETVYEIVPYDITGGQLIRLSDGSGYTPASDPEALYHEAGTRGLLWGQGECG